ncbi:hypothetical protein LO772_02990 [Yinghuangia sp. ASG 101]|uniref:hypothetical protein n=1 Tax=Yinghuangia sp. ASG 101 TaxID=2896848 RepID=UPI001E60D710|nr:hypothetical protein [Yinghuangia sp. ASG 101]UGQ12598.1 hypothetical protein LO772_02990 [Yinghuangia sp. ASG 101]
MQQTHRRPARPWTVPAAIPENPLPTGLLRSPDMRAAGAQRDIGAIFRLAHLHTDLSISRLAWLCDMTPSRVSAYAKGRARARDQQVIERVADGLRIPGGMLGLAPRPWERPAGDTDSPGHSAPTAELTMDVDVELAADGTTSVTYRHTVLNLTDRPLDRLSRRLSFPRAEGSLEITAVPDPARTVTIGELHDAGRSATFTCLLDPPIPPLDTAAVVYRCRSLRYVTDPPPPAPVSHRPTAADRTVVGSTVVG